jgi:transcriptional regulator with XRE-family HTH domain
MRQQTDFGGLIRRLRDKRRWTQEQLAREAGITITCLSNLERGATRDPNPVTVAGLAAAFGLHPSELDARRLAEEVAESARTFPQRQAIKRLLSISDRDAEAVLGFIAERSKRRRPR